MRWGPAHAVACGPRWPAVGTKMLEIGAKIAFKVVNLKIIIRKSFKILKNFRKLKNFFNFEKHARCRSFSLSNLLFGVQHGISIRALFRRFEVEFRQL